MELGASEGAGSMLVGCVKAWCIKSMVHMAADLVVARVVGVEKAGTESQWCSGGLMRLF